jgi:hypothetical protein
MNDSHFNDHGGSDLQENARAEAIRPDDKPKSQTKRELYTAGLRQLANWYDAHPEIPLPGLEHTNYTVDSKEHAAALAKALGTFEKQYSEWSLTVVKMFGNIEARFVFTREQVCTKKVVGVETIPAKFIEAYTIEAQTKEIVEWECHALNVPNQE